MTKSMGIACFAIWRLGVSPTVPVGTGDEVERIIRETRPDADFSVASDPEFLREDAAIRDFKLPDRNVI
jgi:UDPglucose 6-dehydrogenase